jgi:hypothetical protein
VRLRSKDLRRREADIVRVARSANIFGSWEGLIGELQTINLTAEMLFQLLPFSPTNLITTSSSCDALTPLLTTSRPSQPRDEEIYAARPMQPSAA